MDRVTNQSHEEEEKDETKVGKCDPQNRFLFRMLYEMVDDPSTDAIVSWSESGRSFVVWNETEFCRDVVPRFLHYRDMKSFVRKLKWGGFKKIKSNERWEFGHDDFVRGHSVPELPREVVRARIKEMAAAARRTQASVVRMLKPSL